MNDSLSGSSGVAEDGGDKTGARDIHAKSAIGCSKNVRARQARAASSERPLAVTLDVFADLVTANGNGDALVVGHLLKKRDDLVLPSDGQPCQWRNVTPELKARYLQLAIHNTRAWAPLEPEWFKHLVAAERTKGLRYATYTFDLRLSESVQAQALGTSEGPAAYMLRRLRRFLPARWTPFWFAIEFAKSGGWLHVHGTIGCEQGSLDDLRARLLRAGGEFPAEFKPFALRMKLLPTVGDGFRRAAYAVKDAAEARERVGHAPIATLRTVKRDARRLHAKHRELLLGSGSAGKLDEIPGAGSERAWLGGLQ